MVGCERNTDSLVPLQVVFFVVVTVEYGREEYPQDKRELGEKRELNGTDLC